MSDHFNIAKISRLARLKVTPEEEAEFTPQLTKILSYIDTLNELDVSEVEPSSHASPIFAIPRNDEPSESLQIESLEENAPAFAQSQVKVPRVVES